MTDVSVPCGGCTACCRVKGLEIDLHPDKGDDLVSYDHEMVTVLTNPDPHPVLLKKDNGECIYLLDNRCSIYERRPITCREFDCREFYRSGNRRDRQVIVKAMPDMKAVYRAARARMS